MKGDPMKKLFGILMCICLFATASLTSISAEEYTESKSQEKYAEEIGIESSESLFDFKETCRVSEALSAEDSLPQRGVRQKLVEVLIKVAKKVGEVIVEIVIERIIEYIIDTAPNYFAVQQWAANNNVSINDIEVVEYTRVVYDTGCWTPEFPANPFCRIATNNA